LTIRAPLLRADIAGLFERACTLLHGDGLETLVCEVADVAADLVAAEALARLALAARRRGCGTQLRGASPDLRALIELMGLTGTLGVADDAD
jgi:hypothetical protein